MRSIPTWLERLSLDAVLVAVAWGLALSRIAGREDYGWDLVVLGLATWLTYVADRLWEVRPGRAAPDTDRHRYYKTHYKGFLFALPGVLGVALFIAHTFLPEQKVLWGWLLAGLILLYLWSVGMVKNSFRRLLLKRAVVPVIFSSGVALMAESWRTAEGVAGTIVLLSAALANVLLISYSENHDKKENDFLERVCIMSLLLMLVCFNAALVVSWEAGVAGLLCAAGDYFLFMKIKTGPVSHVRAWADGIMAGSALVLLAISWN